MTLATDEFIRRFLIHVLPNLHRIRHCGRHTTIKDGRLASAHAISEEYPAADRASTGYGTANELWLV
jgi:hypothetical protein